MAGHEGEAGEEVPRALLVVGPAEAAGLDSEQGVVVADLGQRQRARDQLAGYLEHDGPGHRAHSQPLRRNMRYRVPEMAAMTASDSG